MVSSGITYSVQGNPIEFIIPNLHLYPSSLTIILLQTPFGQQFRRVCRLPNAVVQRNETHVLAVERDQERQVPNYEFSPILMMLLLSLIALAKCDIPILISYNSSYETPESLFPNKNFSNVLPSGFFYGFASAATQVEGAVDSDGKSLSIWDTFSREKDKIRDRSDTNVTNDEYRLMNETVALLKLTGANSYRFSIAWTRLVPEGRADSPVNPKAISHYNELIDLLVENGITPLVTLYHWDQPLSITKAYGGILDTKKFTEDFLFFAKVAFSEFGDRVKHWVTFNEPLTYCTHGYKTGIHAPGHCINPFKCIFGLPTQALRCGHTSLVAHAHTANMYRKLFQAQKGKISICNNGQWAYPLDPLDADDIKAAQRAIDFHFGWFVDPLYTGEYPKSMRQTFRGLLPTFTEEEKRLLIGSIDFFGFNHYTSSYVTTPWKSLNSSNNFNSQTSYIDGYQTTFSRDDKLIGSASEASWLFNVPSGFKAMLEYIHEKYNAPDIYILENGFAVKHEPSLPRQLALKDSTRINYYQGYITSMLEAMQNGVNVKAYFSWTLTDK